MNGLLRLHCGRRQGKSGIVSGHPHDQRRKKSHAACHADKLQQRDLRRVRAEVGGDDGRVVHAARNGAHKARKQVHRACQIQQRAEQQIESQHREQQYERGLCKMRKHFLLAAEGRAADIRARKALRAELGAGGHIRPPRQDVQHCRAGDRADHDAAGNTAFFERQPRRQRGGKGDEQISDSAALPLSYCRRTVRHSGQHAPCISGYFILSRLPQFGQQYRFLSKP